jgi:hypothetical protein
VKQTIEDIRKLFADNAFKDEQHVRFSLVGRICQKLGWDIWNPKEFYTEYPVKRYPPQEVTIDNLNYGMYTRGRLSASDVVKQCRVAIKSAGYDPSKDLQVGYIKSEHKRKGQ